MKFIKTPTLLKNRRGVNAVISNVILVGAVIAVGFAVLVWSQSQALSYNEQYSTAIDSDTAQLRERLAFEYIKYDSEGKLTVYLMNSGTIGGVSIANAYVNGIPYPVDTLYLLHDDTPVSHLDTNQEGYFWISGLSLDLEKDYPIMIVTGRGSSFVATFATQ
jgi:hypothetical protein